MTKSWGGEENSYFRLWCGRCCHSDNRAAVKALPPVIPVSVHPHLEAARYGKSSMLFMWHPLPLSVLACYCVSVSLNLSLLLPPSPSLFLRPRLSLPLHPHCVLADCRMKRSWCQSLSWSSGSCQHHSASRLSSVEEGLAALKAQHITGHLLCLRSSRLHFSPPLSTLPCYLLSLCLSSPCHWCVEGVISPKSTWSLPLLPAKQPLGTECPKKPGWYIINIQSRLVFDDLI